MSMSVIRIMALVFLVVFIGMGVLVGVGYLPRTPLVQWAAFSALGGFFLSGIVAILVSRITPDD